MSKLEIQVNLSIEKSGGKENLEIIINKVKSRLTEKYPNAEISVRKGYFQTIDGLWSNNSEVENDIFEIVKSVRQEVVK